MPTFVRTAFVAALAAGLFTSRAGAEPTTRPTTAPAPADASQGRIQRKTYDFKEAGREMEYALFVPAKYDKSKRWPLVVALHGLYSNPQQIIRYPGLTEQAEKYGFLVVAPMGYNARGWYGAAPLVKGKADDPPNMAELSERDVMNVLEIVRKDYAIDPDRLYLLGHSMGGGGTWHLAIKHPDLWAALAPIAPATLRPAADLEQIKHVPVFLVQGARDFLVKAERVRPWAAKMKELGMTHEYLEYPNGDHITVAFTSLPKIFAFFDQHKRGERKQPRADESPAK